MAIPLEAGAIRLKDAATDGKGGPIGLEKASLGQKDAPVAGPEAALSIVPMSSPPTGTPQRNFDLPVELRVRALVSGPPAFARRLRAIEDLEEAIAGGDLADPEAAHAKLESLVAAHNRYYPIEANLPTNLRTGELLDRDGSRWKPRACQTVEELLARGAGLGSPTRG